MSEANYRRLTRRNRTWTGFSQAWLGSDHLLIVNSIRFVERYQRFALADIQAIVVSEGGKRAVWQSLVVLICLVAGFASQSSLGRGFFSVIGFCALVVAILDIARGPRCRCVLQTAVSRERLLPISRMPSARAFLAVMIPAIEAAQGNLSAEDLAAHAAATPQIAPAMLTPKPPPLDRSIGFTPEVLFGLLMLDSVLVFVALRSSVGVALGLLPTIYFAEFLIGILALVQSRARSATSLAVLIAAFLCILVDPFALSGIAAWSSLVNAFRQAPSVPQWNLAIGASAGTLLLAAGWRATMAVTGLIVCHFERTARAH